MKKSLVVVSLLITFLPSMLLAQEANRERTGASARPVGEIVVTLNENFLNSMLDQMFALGAPPSYPLVLAEARDTTNARQPPEAKSIASSGAQNSCRSEIRLARESNGVRTQVRFVENRIAAPVAFQGSYNAGLLGCINFEGWADTTINLGFDAARQTLTARVDVRQVNLQGIPQLAAASLTRLVQNAIDRRINPIQILRAEQLATRLPVGENNALQLRAREVRPEIVRNELRLHIVYEIVR
ncbi:MAG: hypothetical protein H0V88_04460 [Pyrinomonadaceae bacterium]|nr:hypothetical protein [Pyrinomonadaceae bacterium]